MDYGDDQYGENWEAGVRARPWRAALVSGLGGLVGVGLMLAVRYLVWVRWRGYDVYGWIWWALAAFVVVVCAGAPLVVRWLGWRGAQMVLGILGFVVIAGMLAGVWWSLQSKNGV